MPQEAPCRPVAFLLFHALCSSFRTAFTGVCHLNRASFSVCWAPPLGPGSGGSPPRPSWALVPLLSTAAALSSHGVTCTPASSRPPPACWVGLKFMDLPSVVTIYVQFWVPFLENKRELEEEQTVWVVVPLTRGLHLLPPPRRLVPRSLSCSRSLGVCASCPHPGGWSPRSVFWSHSLGVYTSCPHPWRLVPAGPSRGLASGFAGNMLRSRLSEAQRERSPAPPSFLQEPGRAGVGAHRGWAKVCWAASAGMRSHLSHRLTLCCLIWTFGLSLSLWILKCL